MIARRIVVHGFVQGVGYRVWLARAARARGVAGSVRNLPDGTVEAIIEGDDDAVEALVEACGIGPRGADVERLVVTPIRLEQREGFEIH